MQASGKSNILGFSRGSTSRQIEAKDKVVAAAPENKDLNFDPLKVITEMVKRMEATHATQLGAMQNRLIAMERSQNNRFQPRQNNDKWQRKGPPQDQRPPNQLESNNVVHEEAPSFCKGCEDFHEESTCPIFCQINEQGLPQTSNYVGQP
jgi:hypothetical protein